MTITRRYTVAEAGLDPTTLPEGWEDGDGKLASAFVRATKPATSAANSGHTAPTAMERALPLPVATMGNGGCCGGSSGSCCGA